MGGLSVSAISIETYFVLKKLNLISYFLGGAKM